MHDGRAKRNGGTKVETIGGGKMIATSGGARTTGIMNADEMTDAMSGGTIDEMIAREMNGGMIRGMIRGTIRGTIRGMIRGTIRGTIDAATSAELSHVGTGTRGEMIGGIKLVDCYFLACCCYICIIAIAVTNLMDL